MGPSYGGPFQSVRYLSTAQFAAGLDVQVKMPWSAEAEAHEDAWSPVKVSVKGRVLFPPLGWSPTYSGNVLASEADVLHSHGLWQHPSWVSLGWKKQYNRPHICSVRGMLEPWAWQHHAWKKRPIWWLMERRNLQSASLLHATSEQEAQSIRDRGLTAPIAVIPNGVLKAGEFESRTSKPASDQRTALFLGRLHPSKGLPLLLQAWAKVRPMNWILNIAGPDEGGHRRGLERLVTLLGLDNLVRFSGPLTDSCKVQAFDEAELFILPTHSENFGIAVAEALARGLPVITTHGAPWELLETESCGWWVPVSDLAIATALEDATRRPPEELIAMGERGRMVVEKRFRWDRIAGEFINCYQWVSGQGQKPECVI
jgi:glycosyltransferase involved in cell wall biosynthesis